MKKFILIVALYLTNLIAAQQVATGTAHNVIIKNDGTLWAWGSNINGQLGDGTTENKNTPTQIGTDSNWKTVIAGGSHTMAMKKDGTLWAWGFNSNGNLGDGTTIHKSIPTQIGTDSDWKFITMNNNGSSFAIKNNGTLWAWGYNFYGQLGDGTTTNKTIPTQVGTATDWKTVTAGYYHIMAIKNNGTLYSWGYNDYGQLGDGTITQKNSPTQIGTASDWKSVVTGSLYSMAIKNDGALWAWGSNNKGQLGDGTTTNKTTPIRIGTATDWKTVTAGDDNTMALKNNGTLWAWGDNSFGQMGDGTTIQKNTPTQVGTAADWKMIWIDSNHTLATKNNGTLWAWGDNAYGQIGDGIGTNKNIPTQIGTASDWNTVYTNFNYTIAIKNDGGFWSWGKNSAGQLGNGTFSNLTPSQIGIASDWNLVSSRNSKTLAIKNNGTLWAWGLNDIGQLGDGTTTNKNIPTQIGTASDWKMVEVELTHNMAIKTNGTLWAWGSNSVGQLGDGTIDNKNTPTQIGTATDWKSVAAGANHSMAIKNNGTLWVWGLNNYGQLGDGTTTSRNIPTQIGTATDWKMIVAGTNYSLALKNDGTLWAWGYNIYGQLGDGTVINKSIPTQIGSANDWKLIDVRYYQSMAIKNNGTLWAWGWNANSRLGDDTTIDKNIPTQIGIATDWKTIWVGPNHMMAIKNNGSLWGWGLNSEGYLGDGTSINKTTPTQIGSATDWKIAFPGSFHTTAIKNNGTLWSWGDNTNGVLGTSENSAPRSISFSLCSNIPSGEVYQTLVSGKTIADLVVTGTSVKWYATATGGSPLSSTATLTNGTTYYATQTINSCESTARLAVQVTINNPTLSATNTTICSGQTATLSVANGTIPTRTIIGYTGPYNYNNHSYYLNSQLTNWPSAKAKAAEIGGYLVSPTTTQENEYVYSLLPDSNYWIGLSDSVQESSWVWESGETSSFLNWYPNEPNNMGGDEDYVQYWTNSNKWNDASIGSNSKFIVEFNSNNTPSYLWSTGATTASITATPSQTTTYWVEVTLGGKTVRKELIITVKQTPLAPTAAATQSFCEAATLANLTATGTAIKWYAAATGGTALANTTALVNGTTYYASQTVDGCESILRLAKQVSINNPTLSASATTICADRTVSLSVNSNLQPTSQFSVGDIGPSGGYIFYDQGSIINGWRYLEAYPSDNGTDSGIESYCIAIPNTSNAAGAGLTNTLNFIASGNIGNWLKTVFLLQQNTSNNWYIPSKDELNLMYTNLKRNNLGNFQDIQYWSSSPASYGSCGINGGVWVQNFTNGAQNSEYRNGYQGAGNLRLIRQFSVGIPATTYLWSTGEETNTITPSPAQTTTYWVDVTTNGVTCRRSITITVNTTPAPTGAATQNLCNGGTIANLSATGSNIKWYEAATGGTELSLTTPLINGAIYYASQTVNGCESKARLRVVTCPNAFITSWQIDTPNQTITFPVQVGNYTYTVNWGDGTNGTYSSSTPITKTYQQSGSYNVSISGTFNQFKLSGNSNLIGVIEWSDREWVSMDSMFANCTRFNAIPATSPNLTKLTDMYATFSGATLFNQNIGAWNVSNVTRMAYAFHRATNFNQDINSWNVANVTNMDSMFQSASNFNQNISSWNVGKVFDTGLMFFGATRFNQPIGSWNVSNVTNMISMFGGATSFNQSLNNWNVSKVTNASNLFNGATSFNQNISNWCTQSTINITNWKLNSPITLANSPNWGTCFSPTGSTTQSLCPGETVASLTATGTSIKWYATATGGTALASNTVLVDNVTYFASQTINATESLTRLAVNVNLNSTITPEAIVTTLSGSDYARDGMGSQAQFNSPHDTAVDALGNVYVTDTNNGRIRKISPTGIVTTFAGSTRGYADGTGTAAQFTNPRGITIDIAGNLYVLDFSKIRKITPTGIVSTLAGSTAGYADGQGEAAQFNSPYGITVDASGNIYVADTFNHRIRKITATGLVSTIAGSTAGFVDETGILAKFNTPYSLVVDNSGTIYVTDYGNSKIRKINTNGVVTTFAGSTSGYADGTGTAAKFSGFREITMDASGTIYVADTNNNRIRKITSAAVVTTIAGSTSGLTDGTGIAAQFSFPYGVSTDASGNIYVADSGNQRIRKITTTGVVTTLAGTTRTVVDTSVENAQYNSPYGIAHDALGNVYIADSFNHRIRKITPTGFVTTLAGSTAGFADGTGANAQFNAPYGITVDALGNVFVADRNNNKIRKISPTGVVTTIAGSTRGFADGAGTVAQFSSPSDLAIVADGTIYVADSNNHSIRKISSAGVVSTIAGSTSGFTDGIGTAAKFNLPHGLVVDRFENIYVADTYNNRIRKITPSGVVTTIAGSTLGFTDGTVTAAQFNFPWGISIDARDNLYIADRLNNRIRKISSTGVVTTIAGSTLGLTDSSGTAAQFNSPSAISIDSEGKMYVADLGNNRIRKITLSTAPTGASMQTFCSGASVANLTATGTGIKWYSSVNAGSALSASTLLVNNTTYFASQTVNGCESVDRLAIKVIVNAADISASSSTICIGNSTTLTASSSQSMAGFSGPFTYDGHRYYVSSQLANWTTAKSKSRELGGYLVSIADENENNFVKSIISNFNVWIGLSDAGQENVWTWDSGEPYVYSKWAETEPNNSLGDENYVEYGFGDKKWNDNNSTHNLRYIVEIPTASSYLWSTGATTEKINVSPSQTTDYWVDASLNGVTCRKSITIIVNNTPNPKGSNIQTFCNSATVGDLKADGSEIKWYASESGGTPLSSTTALVNSTSYFASQTLNGCESIPRLAVNATIFSTLPPTGDAIQTLCEGATLSKLIVTGTGIKWYDSATAGSSLALTTAMVNNTTYYATQTLNGCESPTRLAIQAKISSFPNANLTTSGSTVLRVNELVTISSVSSTSPLTYKWYKDGVLLPNSTSSSFKATTSGKYNVEITNTTGCTSKSLEIPVYVLSQTNYSVSTTEETCLNAKNGKINVKTSLDLPYRATLLLNGVILQTKAFKGEINFDALSGGTYSLCITVDQQADYKECFEIKVNKPQELSVFSTLSNNVVNLSLSGASSYQVNLNGKITITKSSQLTLPVQSGINNLSVSTDKNCQGVFNENFVVYDQISAYPNPFTDELTIGLPDTILMDSTTKLSIKIFNLNGAIVYQSETNKSENILKLNLGYLATGVYLLHIDNAIYKIVKK